MEQLTGIVTASLWPICTAIALIGCAYALFAAATVRRLAATTAAAPPTGEPLSVSILKPLYGAEPQLARNLASFCRQDYPGPVEVGFGVQRASDPAAATVRQLMAEMPDRSLHLVEDATRHGTNNKVSNLINILGRTKNDVIVLADSDIRVAPDYLAHVVGALSRPNVGLVTCLYRGLPGGGVWSRLSALGIDWHFLPSVLVGLRLGLAKPCFGSTIALRRETLQAIGGFESVAGQLADDYAIGAAVRKLGLEVAIPPIIVGHTCTEASLSELVAHDLRWARTIRLVDPIGHLGSVVTHPLPFAFLSGLSAGGLIGFGLIALALACRFTLQIQVDRLVGAEPGRWRLGPARDIMSFAIFLGSLFPGAITWRGRRFGVHHDGSMTPKQ